MKIAVISPKVPNNVKELINIDEFVIYACDSAVSDLIEQDVKIDLAIGDFDSLKDLSLIENIKTIKLNKEKDFSDTSYAINHAYNHAKEVILVGGIKGSRVDHLLANVLLIERYPNLIILDDTNKLFMLEKGIHEISKDRYEYLTLLPVTDSLVTIKGVKYTLNDYFLKEKDQLGLSNEILKDKAILEIKEGKLLIIQSK